MSLDHLGEPPLEFGMLMSRSFANLWLIRAQVAAYLGIVAVLAFAVPLVAPGASGLGLIAYLLGQYWLYHALLKARGLLETRRYHIFAFVGLAFLLILPILFGTALLVLPGLFLVARWIAAPAFVAARGRGSIAAAGDSWQAVRGHTGKVAGAVVLMFLIASATGAVTDGIEGQLDAVGAYRGANPFDVIAVQVFPLMLLGLSTAIYERLGPPDTSIEEVFG